jgi:hypothetical protein
VPVVATEKVAVCPTVTSAVTGCAVIRGAEDAPAPLALLLVLVRAAHPVRKNAPDRPISTSTMNFRVGRDRWVLDIWLRLLVRLRAEMQHALPPTVITGARRPLQLTKSPKKGNCPNAVL